MSRRAEDLNRTDETVDVTDTHRDRSVDVTAPRPQQPGFAPVTTDGNGTAIAAFVLGMFAVTFAISVVSAVAGLLFGLIAIGMGAKGVGNAKRLGGLHKGLAVSGIVSGVLAVLLFAAVAVGGVTLFNQVSSNPQLQNQIEDTAEDVQS